MINLSNISQELEKYNLTEDTYKLVLKDIDAKMNGENDMDWSEIRDKYNIDCNPDTIRKSSSTIFGGKFRTDFFRSNNFSYSEHEYDLDHKLEELRKERMKLQTANLEKNRLDRNEARQEMFYEYIGMTTEALPWPEFKPLYKDSKLGINYLACISDIHYGAKFVSANNEYSPEIAKNRLELFLGDVINFVNEKELNHISVAMLGDALQGLLRVNDLKINDSSVVKATVEISRLLARFINELSAVCLVDYYHVPSANHTQTRPLGSRVSEIADEDLEYVIGHYIKDLCLNNDRVRVHLVEDGSQYIDIDMPGSTIVAGHGHTIKNLNTAIRDLSMIQGREIQYLLVGHFHGDKNFSVNESTYGDCEVIVAPSIVGSDPYADSIMKGSKSSAKIFGFDEVYGLTEQYKFILN